MNQQIMAAVALLVVFLDMLAICIVFTSVAALYKKVTIIEGLLIEMAKAAGTHSEALTKLLQRTK